MSIFQFRDFSVRQSNAALKVGTDAMIFGALIGADFTKNILDIGTGTGVLSLMMAQKYTSASVTGIEVDEQAILDADHNFENSSFSERLHLIHADFAAHSFSEKFDLIISNPPFYSKALMGANLNLNLAKHVLTLTPDLILSKAKSLLNENGSFWIIWPSDDFASLLSKAEYIGLCLKSKVTVFGKPNVTKRIVSEFQLEKSEVYESELTIRDSAGNYTQEYIRLTKDFHDRKL